MIYTIVKKLYFYFKTGSFLYYFTSINIAGLMTEGLIILMCPQPKTRFEFSKILTCTRGTKISINNSPMTIISKIMKSVQIFQGTLTRMIDQDQHSAGKYATIHARNIFRETLNVIVICKGSDISILNTHIS